MTLFANFLFNSSVIACWMGMLKVCGGIRTKSDISDKINMILIESQMYITRLESLLFRRVLSGGCL